MCVERLAMCLVKTLLSRHHWFGKHTEFPPCPPFKFLGAKEEGNTDTLLGGGGSTRYLVLRGGLYQIHWQALNTHGGKRRTGGAQRPVC